MSLSPSITPLVELETLVQLRASWLGGRLTNRQYRAPQADFDALKDARNIVFRTLTGSVFATRPSHAAAPALTREFVEWGSRSHGRCPHQ